MTEKNYGDDGVEIVEQSTSIETATTTKMNFGGADGGGEGGDERAVGDGVENGNNDEESIEGAKGDGGSAGNDENNDDVGDGDNHDDNGDDVARTAMLADSPLEGDDNDGHEKSGTDDGVANNGVGSDAASADGIVNEKENNDNDVASSTGVVSSGEKKRKAPSTSGEDGEHPIQLPSLPLKRARTAYFIFADDNREQLKAQHKGEGVAVIARATGKLWSSLDPDTKAKYDAMAAKERERVARDTALLKKAGLLPPDGKSGGASNGKMALPKDAAGAPISDIATAREVFPVARVRKIAKLDPDVRGLSKEATHLLTKATECFLARLGKETVTFALMQNRRTLLPEDVAEVCSTREKFLFLREDIRDLAREGRRVAEEEREEKKRKGEKNTGDKGATKAVKTLHSFFGAVKS